jgi:hypothetical protein
MAYPQWMEYSLISTINQTAIGEEVLYFTLIAAMNMAIGIKSECH